ncbi:hypothetical protein GBC55_026160 [Pseudomonas sp. TNT3]|nr:hypothetical protein GBC55_026160 [Pseudomonas sp. TNT3]
MNQAFCVRWFRGDYVAERGGATFDKSPRHKDAASPAATGGHSAPLM